MRPVANLSVGSIYMLDQGVAWLFAAEGVRYGGQTGRRNLRASVLLLFLHKIIPSRVVFGWKSQGTIALPCKIASPRQYSNVSFGTFYFSTNPIWSSMSISVLVAVAPETTIHETTNSEVHKAKRKGSNETLALKRILMHNENEGIPITALREIKILRRLRHENIVPLIDIAINPGEYCVFESLTRCVKVVLTSSVANINRPPRTQPCRCLHGLPLHGSRLERTAQQPKSSTLRASDQTVHEAAAGRNNLYALGKLQLNRISSAYGESRLISFFSG